MAIQLAVRIVIGSLASVVSYYADSGVVACPTLIVAVWGWWPLLAVTVPEDEARQLVLDFRTAVIETLGSLKAAAVDMQLSAQDLTHALNRERQCDLFWRQLLLPVDAQRAYHLNRLLSLGLPERTKRMAKIAAVVDLAVERSA